jgi:hypothetical protein
MFWNMSLERVKERRVTLLFSENLYCMSNRIYAPFLIMAFALLMVPSTSVHAASSNPVLVELFTSEGCSSCPPADALLRTLDAKQPVAGAQLIVLEEHVDYWDDLGWKDPFSSHAATQRQGEYVENLQLDSAFTPQMVVDGSESFVGSDRSRAARAIEKAAGSAKVDVVISSLQAQNGKVTAHVATGELPANSEVYIAIALDRAQSDVQRGENGGRRLEHVAVVKRLAMIGKVKKGDPFSHDVTIDVEHSGQAHRLIAFVQEAGQGKVLGATVARFQ